MDGQIDDGWMHRQKDKSRKIQINIQIYIWFTISVFTHPHIIPYCESPEFVYYHPQRCYSQKNIDLQSKINLMKASVSICLTLCKGQRPKKYFFKSFFFPSLIHYPHIWKLFPWLCPQKTLKSEQCSSVLKFFPPHQDPPLSITVLA